MKISDSRLAGVLGAIMDGSATARIVPTVAARAYELDLKVEVHDNHRGDSPDAVLWLTVTVRHPALPKLTLRVPVPIEGELAGISAARDDLRKFAERERFALQIPMLVVGGSGNPSHATAEVRLKTKVTMDMIPYRQVAGS